MAEGPGLRDRDVPPQGCAADEDPLLATIQCETDAILRRCERRLLALEAKYAPSARARYLAALRRHAAEHRTRARRAS